MALITETNQQYYRGVQAIKVPSTASGQSFTFAFNTQLSLGSTTSYDSSDADYSLNNFKIYTASTLSGTYTEYTSAYTISDNVVTITGSLTANHYVKIELKDSALFHNYGGYSYITLNDIINNFLVGYVGEGKLIPNVKRTDVMFHAKRGLQEFSYDTLKSIKAQELVIPDSLSVPIPQDYVNYVKSSWIDSLGVKHTIQPTQLSSNPTEIPVQGTFTREDDTSFKGIPTQDDFGNNVETTSTTETNWDSASMKRITGGYDEYLDASTDNNMFSRQSLGRRYGLNPNHSQVNGFFTINEREGKISYSSDLSGATVILEYISDGLAYDNDTRVPKLAEEAMYMHIAYSILAGRSNVQEYVVARFKKDRRAALRNAKIRLSNIKLEEIAQVLRGKSKQIKH